MKSLVLLLSVFLFIPLVSADYPTNPKDCCIYCPYGEQELCFWNDTDFLYMSIDPDGVGTFCGDIAVIQDGVEYDSPIYGYDESDNFVCGDISVYTEVRIADSSRDPSSPFDAASPMSLIVESCDGWYESVSMEYPSDCGLVSTTSTTTSIFDSRHQKRDFYLYDGNGYVTVDVTNKIIFKITVTDGEPFFCNVLSSIVQNGQEYEINEVIPAPDKFFVEWETYNPPFPYDHYFFGCGDIYEGEIVTGTMNYFPPPFNINDSFRINCNIWDEDDYFDIEAGEQPTTSTTTTPILPTTSIFDPTTTTSYFIHSSTTVPQTTTTINTGQPGDCSARLIYGNNSAETELLRYIRDNVLAQTPEGREIIKLYYEWSPAIVRALEADPGLKEDLKEMVDSLIGLTNAP
jgi:hypothetical protein